MVRDPEGLVQFIVEWIQRQVTAAGATGGVFGLSGGADSALVAILTKRAFPKNAVGVLMPCHSSQSSLDRAKELAAKFDIDILKVDLAAAFESIAGQVLEAYGPKTTPTPLQSGALRSCLRAPTLDFVAKLQNALIIGTGNRDEDELTRYFQKRGDGAVDISPIAKLHKSEVYELLRHLGAPQSIIDAVPSADLWGPDSGQEDEKELGLTYEEIEWGIRVNDRAQYTNDQEWTGFVLNDFETFTPRQIQVLKKLQAMEKASRHKSYMPPVLDLRFTDYVK